MKRLPPCPLFQLWLLLPLLALAPAAALHAQLPKVFVASYGNDASDGSRGSPKRNFQAAHDTVAAGGQIVVLDTAGYGTLNITKSLSITVPPGVNGFVTISGAATAIFINTTAATDTVSLRGLIVENSAPSGISCAIQAGRVGTLTVEDCLLRNCTAGILFAPVNNAELYLHRTTARGGDGFNVQPTGAYDFKVVITDCLLEKNSSSGLGVFATTTGSSVDLTLADCVLAGNAGSNIFADGSSIVLRVDNCRITGSNSGAGAFSGAQILSRGNNTLENNTFNNGFPVTYSAK
jgi:hypothetical protein